MDSESITLNNYRVVMFELSNGAQTPVSLCDVCSDHDWGNPERLAALKTQMDDAMEQSSQGKMYTLTPAGTWELLQRGTPIPPEIAAPEMAAYRALSVVRPLTLGRFLTPEQLVVVG